MKQKIPDQAEKLRQIAAKEQDKKDDKLSSLPTPPSDTASEHDFKPDPTSVVAVEESPDSIQENIVPEPPPAIEEKTPAKPLLDPKEKQTLESKLKKKNREIVQPEVVTEPTNKVGKDGKPFSSEVETIQKKRSSESAGSDGKEDKVINDISLLTAKRLPFEKYTRVIAVTGGKGGVGKSNIACALGIAFCQMGKKVLLLDADLSLANVDVILGLTPRLNLSHVIQGEKKLEEVMIHGPGGLGLIPGGSGLEELSNLSQNKMDNLFQAFTGINPSPDIFLIDTAAGLHSNVMNFLLCADQVIVVTTPEPPAYTDAYALIKTLVKHDKEKDIGVLVNMARDAGEATEVAKLMLQMSRQFLNVAFNNLGYIPRDPVVLESVRFQQSFLLYAPASSASKSIRNIAASVLQISGKDSKPRGLRHFFRKLFGQSQSQKAAASS